MKLDIEIDDKGEIVGDPPEGLKAIFARIENTAHGQGFGKGAAKAAEEAKAQILAAVAAEKAKLDAMAPLEREKFARESEENKTLKAQMLEGARETDRQQKAREEVHATQLLERAEALKKRNVKIQALVTAQLKALAAQNGARDESLPELEVILGHRIKFDDEMEPYVVTEDGSGPATHQGKPLTLDLFVKQYLDNHPHHRKPVAGQGGGARGGASLRTTTGSPASLEQAKQSFAETRSPESINAIFEAGRKKSA